VNTNENVLHPGHYTGVRVRVTDVSVTREQTTGEIECIDLIRSLLTPEQFAGYCRGNALKYTFRAGRKQGTPAAEDLRKARQYCEWAAETEERSHTRKVGREERIYGIPSLVDDAR
jgi:hypothetical protein